MRRLREDAEKLLYIISLYTGGEVIKWIKNYALWVLVYYGIINNVFKSYDYAPTVVMWHGAFRVANISMEAEKDLLRLRNEGLIEKLRLATSKYRYITAYRVSKGGLEYLKGVPAEIRKSVDAVFRPGGSLVAVVLDDYRPLLRMPDGRTIDIGFLEAEDVPYESDTYYLLV